MKDAGLVEAVISDDGNSQPEKSVIIRLTWAGHDFLDSTKSPAVWKKTRETILDAGVSWTFSVLMDFLKVEASRALGLR